jgi:hypothetical protein
MEGLKWAGPSERAARSRSGSAAANRFRLASSSRFPQMERINARNAWSPCSLFFLVTAG